MTTHLLAVSLTFLIYTCLAVAYLGWGRVTFLLLGIGTDEHPSAVLLIWTGWGISLFLFQMLHFFTPINFFAVLPIFLMGFGFAVPSLLAAFRNFDRRSTMPNKLILLVFLAIAFAFLFWVASRAMLSPSIYDSGLYHFNKIRWINSYPVVPGLGNLHGRLAFNQSFFTYVAALNFHPFFGHGRVVANSFLLLLTVATFVDLLCPLFKRPSLLLIANPFRYTTVLILFPPLIYLALSSNGLASPSPDLTTELLQLVLFVVFSQGLGEWLQGEKNQNTKATFLLLLATTAVTVKLSTLAFATTIGVFVLAYLYVAPSKRSVARALVFSIVISLSWCIYSVILSGAPLYPSTIGYLAFNWSVPVEQIIDTANWVYSWARQPRTHWSNVLGNWNWFHPWLARISKNSIVVNSVKVSIFCLLVASTIAFLKKKIRPFFIDLAVLLPSITGLVYWFFTAPDFRFARVLFFIISASSVVILLSSFRNIVSRRGFLLLICISLVVPNLSTSNLILKNRSTIRTFSLSGWHSVKTVPLEKMTTSSGLEVYVPKKGDQCWDSPLPSTPYFDPRLRLREQGNLESGFTIKE